MGTIQKRGDNNGVATYQARIRRKGFPHLSKNFPTLEAAQAWIEFVEKTITNEAAAKVAAETRKALGLMSLGDLIERYLRTVTPTTKSEGSEKYRLGKLMRSELAQCSINSLSSVAIAEWRNTRLTEVKASTVAKELHNLSRIVTFAQREWGLELARNPFRQVTKPKQGPGRERRLLEHEAPPLMAAAITARGGFLALVILFAVETAMRQGEIVRLDWQHIDLKKQTAHLPDTKNGTPRTVPLSLKAVAILRMLAVIELTPERSGPVFPGVTGEAVKRAFQNACKRADIENLRFHDLRHEGISRLFEKGLNPMEVSFISGHKDLRMLKRYTHLDAPKLAKKLG